MRNRANRHRNQNFFGLISSAILIGLLSLNACAPTPMQRPVNGPIELSLSAKFSSDVPISQTGFQGVDQLKGSLDVTFHGDTSPADPKRSNYQGSIHLLITSPDGQRTFFNYENQCTGEIAGDTKNAEVEFWDNIFAGLAQAMPEWMKTPMTQPSTRSANTSLNFQINGLTISDPTMGELQMH